MDVIFVELLERNNGYGASEVSQRHIADEPATRVARYVVSLDKLQQFPGSLLHSVIGNIHEDISVITGSTTIPFYDRDPDLFDVAMQVYSTGSLNGINVVPLGKTFADVEQELQGFWKLPFNKRDILAALKPSNGYHLTILAHHNADTIWQQITNTVDFLYSGNSQELLTSYSMLGFLVSKRSSAESNNTLQQVHLLRDKYILAQIADQLGADSFLRCFELSWTEHREWWRSQGWFNHDKAETMSCTTFDQESKDWSALRHMTQRLEQPMSAMWKRLQQNASAGGYQLREVVVRVWNDAPKCLTGRAEFDLHVLVLSWG